MRFRSFFAIAAVIGLAGASLADAADEPQVVRQEMMKKVGGAVGAMAKMVKGEADFDADATLAAFQTISDTIVKFPEQFPVGSETGFETEAAPTIWEKTDEFKAKAANLKAAADAIIASPPADLDSLKAAFGPFTKNCGACHETFRIKKDS